LKYRELARKMLYYRLCSLSN